MQIEIDKNRCIGCGLCVFIAPDVFELGDDGKSRIKNGVDLEKNKELITQAKENCPAQGIEVR